MKRKDLKSGVVCSRCLELVPVDVVEFVDDYPVCSRCLTHRSLSKSFLDNNQYTLERWYE